MHTIKDNIELLIQNGKTFEALNELLYFLKGRDKSLYNKVLILAGEYKEIKLEKDIGKIRDEDYRTSLIRIKSSIIDLCSFLPLNIVNKNKITNLPDRDWIFLAVSADYINDVFQLINDENRRPYLNLILGMAGIGKTYLARKVAFEYSIDQKERFDIIWFVNSETVESIINDLKELATYFNIQYEGDKEVFLKKLKLGLTESEMTWLIVFDNACDKSNDNDNPNIFANKYFPRTEFPKQILVTSQNLDWYYIFNPKKHIRLKNWSYSDYVEFLIQNNIQIIENRDIEFLFEEFGGLPLAIAQTVGYVKKKNITIKKYIDLLKKNKEKLLNKKEINIDYKNSVLNAIILSFNSLNDNSKTLLILISFLSPDNIPIDLINEKVQNIAFYNNYLANNPFYDNYDLENAKSDLLQYSLAEQTNINKELISIHRLIKTSIQLFISNENKYINYLKEITKIINLTFNVDTTTIDVEEYENFEILHPHILNVLANCSSNIKLIDEGIKEMAILSFKLGKYYNRLGNDHEALIKLKEAKHFNNFNTVFFDELLDSRINLQTGHLYYLADEIDSANMALPLFESAFSIFEKYNLQTEASRSINNIGSIYLMRRDYENAILWYEKGLSVSQECFLYHNLGYVYQSQGEYETAIELYNKSLGICIVNKTPHRIGINYHLLGIVYGLCSNFEKQNEYHSKCLRLYRDMQQARRISYCLFQMINFAIDRQENNDEIYSWYREHQKYYDIVSDDSEYKLNSIVLKCRFAILSKDSIDNINILYQEITNIKDLLLCYPTDSHGTSLYLDFSIYYFLNNYFSSAKTALNEAINFNNNRKYHRSNEIKYYDELINKN